MGRRLSLCYTRVSRRLEAPIPRRGAEESEWVGEFTGVTVILVLSRICGYDGGSENPALRPVAAWDGAAVCRAVSPGRISSATGYELTRCDGSGRGVVERVGP